MKQLLLTFCCLFAFSSFSQTWEDSLKYARKLYQSGDYGNAFNIYKDLEKNQPQDIDLSNEIGQAAYKSKDYDFAKDKFESGLKNKKNNLDKAKTNHNLGNTMMGKEDYQNAIKYYKDALKNNPDDVQTRYNLSEAIRRLKDNNQNNEEDKNNPPKENENKEDNKNKDQSQKENNSPKSKNNNQNPANKPNNSVERLLDQLNKKDAANNKKYDKQGGEIMSNTKDW